MFSLYLFSLLVSIRFLFASKKGSVFFMNFSELKLWWHKIIWHMVVGYTVRVASNRVISLDYWGYFVSSERLVFDILINQC